MNRPVSKPLITLVTALIVAVTFSAGFLIGKQEGIRSVVPAGEGKVIGVGEIPSGQSQQRRQVLIILGRLGFDQR